MKFLNPNLVTTNMSVTMLRHVIMLHNLLPDYLLLATILSCISVVICMLYVPKTLNISIQTYNMILYLSYCNISQLMMLPLLCLCVKSFQIYNMCLTVAYLIVLY